MPRLYSNRNRPFDLGPLPWEALARERAAPISAIAQPADDERPSPDSVAGAIPEYLALFAPFLGGERARARAEVPDDPLSRARNLKASAYFLDVTLAGGCLLEAGDWIGERSGHGHALVFAIEFGRQPAWGEPGDRWIRGTHAARTDLRCTEVACVLAGYLRALGFDALGHAGAQAGVDLARLAQRAGLAREDGGRLRAPFLSGGFRIGAVTTDYVFEPDLPLARDVGLDFADPAHYLGRGGTRPGFEAVALARRPMHLGRYPMETIARVDQPTTLILRDEIRRVPRRADMFTRAMAGDLGERARAERGRFATKHPLAFAMTPMIRAMVPLQGTREPLREREVDPGDLSDPRRNADAIKALAYHLGADLVGICRAEPWMYYSHEEQEGRPIDAYHSYAVVMLIDQGFETMEGASGDDWISGAQSMRAYLRGAMMAGVIAAHLRRLGYSSRAHSNAYSELLQLPAMLMAGLGEMPRIGELVLNPFIGPRSKCVLLTTDLPLEPDQPIDFGLQRFCQQCLKCARECPCAAIPFGPKVMYNGYEIWKPDVEKCAKYRLTNARGSACGRCMKTCPFDREDLVESERLLRLSIEDPASHRAIIEEDDACGGGQRNPVKRWWFDLEIVDGVALRPRAGTNQHDLQPGREAKLAAGQRLAMFPPALQPAGDVGMRAAVPVDRSAGLAEYARAESPEHARRRRGVDPSGA